MHDHEHHGPSRSPWYSARPRPTPSTPPGQMRISDADRTEVTNALVRHLADGRLDEAEFNDRAARAAAAKTGDDLAPLLVDLPPLSGAPPEDHAPRRGRLRWVLLGVLLVGVAGWSTVGAAASAVHPRVPWVLVIVAAFILLRHRRRRRHDYR